LEEFQLSVDKVEPAAMTQALTEFNIKDKEELLAQIGLGERLAPLVARRLLPGGHDDAGKITPLTVAGTEGLLVTYARCCRPIPDDPIIAYLSAGRGIVIHRETWAMSRTTTSIRRSGSPLPGRRTSTASSAPRCASRRPTRSACWPASRRP